MSEPPDEHGLKQIAALLAEYEGMRSAARHEDLSDLPEHQLVAFSTRLAAAIQRLAPRSSSYAEDAARLVGEGAVWRIIQYVGILSALQSDILSGWMTRVEELLHADTFSDFIEMSNELLGKGYKDAAAVITGTVLEVHLRLLASKNGVALENPGGSPRKAESLNADFAKENVYHKMQQKQVTAWLGLRNSAAHGSYDEYAASDVARFTEGVRDFLLRYPA